MIDVFGLFSFYWGLLVFPFGFFAVALFGIIWIGSE